jgi:hypothetical protein
MRKKFTRIILVQEVLMRMVPDFISIDANHVEKNLFMQALNFVLDTVSIVAMH